MTFQIQLQKENNPAVLNDVQSGGKLEFLGSPVFAGDPCINTFPQ